MTVNVNTPTRKDPGKKELLNLFEQSVQILVDNGIKLPESAILEYLGQRAIETTPKPRKRSRSTLLGSSACQRRTWKIGFHITRRRPDMLKNLRLSALRAGTSLN